MRPGELDSRTGELEKTMAKTALDDKGLDLLAYDISDMIDRFEYAVSDEIGPDEIRAALPAFLAALGVTLPGEQPPPADDFVRHTCWPDRPGEALPFGRGQKLPRGTCKRCDQLNDGAPRREAPAAIQAGIDKRRLEGQRSRDIEAHYAPGGGHEKCMAKSIVPTCFDW